ncbi:unnamed protein product [Angiostrongylus costaricensis]|uniref:Uncharacterized protein n=1 Tax=Angiostrongylus costaricensis TaxID=334426 RepID=A0A0R3PCJ0_ANGCS|nr:unnamed protein product [Angiostrongylus costaricensis]
MPKATAIPEVVIKPTKTENQKSAKTTSTKTGIIQMNKEKMIPESVTNDGTKVVTVRSIELRLKNTSEKLTAKEMDSDDAKRHK